MSILKKLEELAQNPNQSINDFTLAQKKELEALKQNADFLNANMMIASPNGQE